jgi:hypothetical protein
MLHAPFCAFLFSFSFLSRCRGVSGIGFAWACIRREHKFEHEHEHEDEYECEYLIYPKGSV